MMQAVRNPQESCPKQAGCSLLIFLLLTLEKTFNHHWQKTTSSIKHDGDKNNDDYTEQFYRPMPHYIWQKSLYNKKRRKKRNQHENVKDMVHTTEYPTLNFKKEIYINIITLTQWHLEHEPMHHTNHGSATPLNMHEAVLHWQICSPVHPIKK